MEPDKEFDEFVKQQVSAKTQEPTFDPVEELQKWLQSLDELYKKVETFLETYIATKQIEVEYRDVELNEEFSGPYNVRQMILKIGLKEVTLKPIGTMLIGTRGRVDVLGPAGRATISLLNKKATSARSLVSVTVHVGGKPLPPKPQGSNEPIEWEWKIVSPPPELRFTPLSRDEFLKLILEVANA